MVASAMGTRVKEILCKEHGGTFSVPVGRGRYPSKCGDKYDACGGRPKATRKRVSAPERVASQIKNKRVAALEKPRPGRRERATVVIGEDDMRPMAERVRRESRSERTGWCSCKQGGRNHERGTGKCKYNQPDPTTTAKPLASFFAYFPARMRGNEWVILHAVGCDHLNERQMQRTDTVELDLFADDMSENLSKLDVDELGYDWNGVGISNCALNHAKRHRTATQKAAREAAPLTKAVNPCVPLAHKAKGTLEPLGWIVKGRAAFRIEVGTTGDERSVPFAEVTATRGTETLVITWWTDANGEIQSTQDYSLWNTEKPSENEKPLRPKQNDGKPKHRLPFNPALVTDAELIREIVGRKVVWWNALRKGEESGEVSPTKIQIESVYNGNGNEIPSERIVKFLDPGKTGGFRAFHLSALLAVR